MPDLMTVGEVADALCVQAWKVARLYRRGLLPEPKRLGRYRMVPRTELPAVDKALRTAGYKK